VEKTKTHGAKDKGLIWMLIAILEWMVAHNFIMIYIEGVIAKKPTLVLVNLGTHNLMFEVFASSLSHPIGTLDPSRILLPTC